MLRGRFSSDVITTVEAGRSPFQLEYAVVPLLLVLVDFPIIVVFVDIDRLEEVEGKGNW